MSITPEQTEDPQLAIVCDVCAVVFTIPAPLQWRHDNAGAALWCPNGHLLGSDFTEPVTLALARAHDLAHALGSELALERIDHHKTRQELRDILHGLTLGACPVGWCEWTSKAFAAHVRTHGDIAP